MINKAKLNASKNDECYTPAEAVVPLIKHLPDWVNIVWCPCDKPDSEIVKALKAAGKNVLCTHIDSGEDFLKMDYDCPYAQRADMIITNPPYSNKDDFIAHCVHLAMPWALLLPLDSLCGERRHTLYEQATDVGCITLHKRLDFTGKGKNWFYNAWVCAWPEMKNKWIQE